MREKLRRLPSPELLVVGLQLLVAWWILGAPDPAGAGDFLRGAYPTGAGVVAASQLVLWMVMAALGLAVAIQEVRARRPVSRRRDWSAAVLVIGVAILVSGLLHRADVTTMCCGRLDEAVHAVGDGR